MVFFNLRQRNDSIQGLLMVTPEKVSKQMVKWAAGIATESIVLVEGIAQAVRNNVHTDRFQAKAHYLLWCVVPDHRSVQKYLYALDWEIAER